MIDAERVINEIQISPEARRLVDTFVSPRGVGRRYLFGRNEHSAALAKVIDIDGFVDDFAGQGSIWEGKPVMKGSDVPKQAIVVNCVMNSRPITALKRIQKLGFGGILAYSDMFNALPDLVPLPNFILESRNDLHQNLKKWQALSSSLNDDQSRQTLDDLLRFRLTGNYLFMIPYPFRPRDQYFEDFLRLAAKETFVDAGGFDGDTTESFINRYPEYDKVYFFEPSPGNMAKAQVRLQGCRSVEFLQLGLADFSGKVGFNPNEGSSSAINDSGSSQIDLSTLDQQISEPVTFIKMDLEGWELKALKGARRHIVTDHPKLAIAVYHHPADFWKIYEYVIDLRQDYRTFLRHYTESWTETVMYFVHK